MGTYDTQQVCIKGHQVTDSFHRSPEFRREHCSLCGEKTLHACPKCDAEIRGRYEVPGVVTLGFETPVPPHCESCGAAFAWKAHKGSTGDSTSSLEPEMLLHVRIKEVAEGRLRAGHYADAVEAAIKEINSRVKAAWIASGNFERDGSDLMFHAFDPQKPVIRVADLQTDSGKSAQKGYQHLFSGSIMAIRNPKAHENINITHHRALQFLVLASLLMEKLDEAGAA